MSRLFRYLSAICLVVLAACASAPESSKVAPPRPARENIRNFALSGRTTIIQGSKANTIRILWEHWPDHDDIGFASLVTGMIAELLRDANGASWVTASGERYDARDADQLIARLTETPVPISSLALWVTGRVGANALDVSRDAAGRLVHAEDNGWEVNFISYETDSPNAMPKVMEVAFGSLRIRLAFEEYVL